jgi:hypothetical protein
MIICKRPCTLYDVDVAGLGGLVLLAALAYFVIVVPMRAHWSTYRDLSAQHRSAEAVAQQTGNRVRQAGADIARLGDGVAALAERAPEPGSLPQFLSRATDLAEQAQLEVFQVLPHATRAVDEYLIADIEMSGCGRSLDFIGFLDALARENPYQSLQQFSITQPDGPDDGLCDLSWTIRLYMLPSEPSGGDP